MTTFTGTPGTDTFVGSNAAQDIFNFAVANLGSADTVNGGTGAFTDELRFTTAGTVAAAVFAHVSHIEQINLANGTNNVTLTDALAASSDASHTLTIYTGTGADTVNAAALSSADAVRIVANTGNDVLTGGAGADSFYFAANTLTGADQVNGGSGASKDILYVNTAGTLGASALSGVTHVEQISLTGGDHNVTLNDAMISASDTSHLLTVMSSGSQNDIVSGGAVSALNHITFYAGAGNDVLTGGDAADIFLFATADLTSADIVSGGTGAGSDVIKFLNAGTVSSLAFSHVTNIETIQLANGTNDIGLYDAMVASSDNNATVTVLGGTGSDTIDASSIVTPSNTDILYGRGGADVFFASAGKDIFSYLAVSESNGSGNGAVIDVFHGFDAAVDKIDLPSGFSVAGVQTVSTAHGVSHATFDADLSAAIGSALTSHEAVLFQATSGDFSGTTFLVINPTATNGYAAGQDYVFDVSGSLSDPFTTGTFI